MALHYPYSRTKADNFLRKMVQQIKKGLSTDGFVKVKGLGTFKIVTVNSRESVDVNTGERIEISEHQRLVFTPDIMLKNRVNRPFEKFETIILDESVDTSLIDLPLEADQPLQEEGAEEETGTQIEAPQEAEVQEKEKTKEAIPFSSLYIGEEQVQESYLTEPNQEKEETIEPEPVKNEELPSEVVGEAENEEEQDEEGLLEEEERKNTWWKFLLWALLMLLLMAASYYAGSRRMIVPTEWLPAIDTIVIHDTIVAEMPQNEENLSEETEERPENAYEQMEGGDYLIIGTEDEHTMREGDTLLKLSRKYYGNTDCVKYIIFFNQISNPDVISLGTTLKIPRLVNKSEKVS